MHILMILQMKIDQIKTMSMKGIIYLLINMDEEVNNVIDNVEENVNEVEGNVNEVEGNVVGQGNINYEALLNLSVVEALAFFSS